MANSYGLGEIFADYFRWHYGRGYSELMSILENFLLFILHFFSLAILFKTLFHPWRRMSESHGSGLELETFFSALLVNTIMRLVGFVNRSVIIVIGIFFFFFYAVIGFVAMIAWFFAPFIAIALTSASIPLILNSII